MKTTHKISLLFLLILSISFAQQKTLSLQDAVLGYYKGLYPRGLDNLQWLENEDTFIHVADNQSVIFKDAKTQQEKRVLTLDDFRANFPRLRYIPYITSASNNTLIFRTKEEFHEWNFINKTKKEYIIPQGAENVEFNRNNGIIAYTHENNLYIKTPTEIQAITQFKDKNIVAGQAIHRSEYGINKGIFWSPKNHYIAFYQKDESEVTPYPLIDITTIPATYKPIKYPMAGDKSEKAKVGIYQLSTKKTIYLEIDTNDYHYLTNLSWSPDEKYILLAEINRETTQYKLNRYDVATGKKINTILTESNAKWVEPENEAIFLPNKTDEFLWLSQKDGFKNLYHYTINGKLKKQVTHYKWVIKDILGFSEKGKEIIIAGTGNDARETHIFKVNLKTGKTINVTPFPGTHNAQLSSTGNYLLDEYSSLQVPKITQIITLQSNQKVTLNTSENPLKDYKWGAIDFVDLKSEDGKILHSVLMKPADFDPNKKYPVLIYVYGGPHAQLVTNSFLGGSSMWLPAFATLKNYIVFTLDNRGSAHRGFDFESVIHRNLGENEMKDQMVGVNYLKSLPYVDANRIAINGWSFGGFMTTSLMLRYPGVFTTAVAGGPVVDWRMYEVMYGERYMDTPQENPQGYAHSKVSNYIKNLKGKLLIITGSVDPTVVPQHSMVLLQEAVKNNIPIDFFSYPMHEHNIMGKDRVHLIEKMTDYIVEHNQ